METKKTKKDTKGSKEHKKSWQETYASIDDIMTFLDNHVMLRHNVVTGRVEYRFPTTYYNKTPTEWQPISDRVVNSLWTDMARGHPVRIQDIQRVIESDYVLDYDPFKFYMDDLPLWNEDKEDYIMELAMSVIVKGEAEEQMLFCQCLKKWLVGMVACWLDPKVVNNVILVLIGEQGSYKTTWFSCLLPPELRAYFRIKTNASRMTKDDLLSLTQYGLVCYEELDTMGNRELNELKSAVTMPSIDEQRIVERQNQHFRIESDEEQLIRSRLRPPHADEKITLMNAASIAQYINGGVVGRGLSSRKVSLAMGRLGFKNVHTKAGNFFEVYQIPANEIQPTLAYVDENAENEPSMPTMTEGDLPF